METVVAGRDHLPDILGDLAEVALEEVLSAPAEHAPARSPLVGEGADPVAVRTDRLAIDTEAGRAGPEAHEVAERAAAFVDPENSPADNELAARRAAGGNRLGHETALAEVGGNRLGESEAKCLRLSIVEADPATRAPSMPPTMLPAAITAPTDQTTAPSSANMMSAMTLLGTRARLLVAFACTSGRCTASTSASSR